MSPRVQSTRRPSAAQARRLRQAVLQEREHQLPLPDDFEPWLSEQYKPRVPAAVAVWPVLQPVVLEVLRRSRIRGRSSLRARTSDVSAFLAWAHGQGYGLEIDVVMRRGVIDEYARVGMSTSSGESARDRRARLRTIAEQIHPGETPWRAPSLPRQAVRPPYTEHEMASIRRVVWNQPTDVRVRELCLLVGVGAGAGLDSADLRQLRAEDVDDRQAMGLLITVSGQRPRQVWVLAAYERFVRRGLEGLSPEQLVIGTNPDRVNIAAPIVNRASWHGDLPHLEQSRLRTTWLTHHLRRAVPLPLLCAAAGLSSARTLFDLLPYLEPTGPVDGPVRGVLRGEEGR